MFYLISYIPKKVDCGLVGSPETVLIKQLPEEWLLGQLSDSFLSVAVTNVIEVDEEFAAKWEKTEKERIATQRERWLHG